MRSNGSKSLYEYWDRLRGSRQAPERGEIEPSDIRELLGDTFILEINNRMKTISFRLAGTRLCSIYGRELKGFGYLGIWNEEDNLQMIRTVNNTYLDFKPMLVSHKGYSQTTRTANFETLLLPLLPAADGSSRVLGLLSATGEVPFWLGADPILSNSIIKVRDLPMGFKNSDNFPNLAPEMSDFELSQGSSRNSSEPGRQRRFGHLRIIDGGKTDDG